MKTSIEISADQRLLYVKEDLYVFRNFFGDVEFNEGIHYWEIVADARTEHELKVGVSAIRNMEDSHVYQDMMNAAIAKQAKSPEIPKKNLHE